MLGRKNLCALGLGCSPAVPRNNSCPWKNANDIVIWFAFIYKIIDTKINKYPTGRYFNAFESFEDCLSTIELHVYSNAADTTLCDEELMLRLAKVEGWLSRCQVNECLAPHCGLDLD